MTKNNELSWVGCLGAAVAVSMGLALAAAEAWIVMVLLNFFNSLWSVIPAIDFLPIFLTWVTINILALIWLSLKGAREVEVYGYAVDD